MHACGRWVITAAAAPPGVSVSPTTLGSFRMPFRQIRGLSIPFHLCPFPQTSQRTSLALTQARKGEKQSDPVARPTIVEELQMEEDEEDELLLFPEVADDVLDDNDIEDEYMEEDVELYAGDGCGGGGISLAGTWWDKEALAKADSVSLSLDGDLSLYAFKTLGNGTIRIRIEKMSNRSGSPNMSDIELFTSMYRERLDEAVVAGTIPEDFSLEVSSPGIDRVVRIPQDLERFRDRAMHVKYRSEVADPGSPTEQDGIFQLISFSLEERCCSWGLADVRKNREKAGKGKPLNKKQREWRLNSPFDSLLLVRLYPDM